MQNKLLLFLCLILCVWGGAVMTFAEDETLTIQTYYPSPNGVYKQLKTNQLTIGSNYRGATYADGVLYVENIIGIGTSTPDAGVRLDVAGDVKAQGKLDVTGNVKAQGLQASGDIVTTAGKIKAVSVETDSVKVTKDFYINNDKIFIKKEPLSMCANTSIPSIDSKTCTSGETPNGYQGNPSYNWVFDCKPPCVPADECKKLCNVGWSNYQKTCTGQGECASSCTAFAVSHSGGPIVYADRYWCYCTKGTCSYNDCNYISVEKCTELK